MKSLIKKAVIVTGSGGLVGAEACRFYHQKGYRVIGIDNDKRSYFFGESASTKWQVDQLKKSLNEYEHHDVDIASLELLDQIFKQNASSIEIIIHCAAQPSHDWAAREPLTDFEVNASATLKLLECTRKYVPLAVFIFTSTNKVYGDNPNSLPLVELPTRWEIADSHSFYSDGIDESMSIDNCTHSIFGVSKIAADLMVQEYGRYFGLNTIVFRGGCLTGPSHSGAELHGFLAYLVKCATSNKHYTVFGYKGKQVRDNIHSADLISAFWEVSQSPPQKGSVYNMGGSRYSNISMIEAITWLENKLGKPMNYTIDELNHRKGDHIWYVSDVSKFKADFPNWSYRYNIEDILEEMVSIQMQSNSLK